MVATVIEGITVALGFLDEIVLLTSLDELGVAVANGLGVLGHPVRRKVLALLSERNYLSRTDLAERIASDDEIGHASVERVDVSLHHNHLPKLGDHGYIEYDRRSGDAVLRTEPSAVRSSLRTE